MHRGTRVALAVLLASATLASIGLGAATASEGPPSESDLVVLLEDRGVAGDSFTRINAATGSTDGVEIRRPDAFTVTMSDEEQAEELARDLEALPEVAQAAALPKGTVRPLGDVPPNDSIYPNQRTYLGPTPTYTHSINVEPVWDSVFNGSSYAMVPYRKGVTIAVIDTGVSATLREQTGEYEAGWDYAYDDDDPDDVYGHGTQVASILRAQENNAYGISGVLHESTNTIVVYKTIRDNGTGDTADTIMALMDAADRGAKIINASLGDMAVKDAPSSTTDRTYDLTPDLEVRELWNQAVKYCSDRGSIVVASAGNKASTVYYNGDSHTDLWYPAASPDALAVGGIVPATGLRWFDSCYGPELDIVAAGKGVWLITNSDSTAKGDGTSYAAPLVSGSLGLLWSLVPNASDTTMLTAITQTAVDYPISAPDGPDDEYGQGRLDVGAAYAWMKSNIAVQPPVTVSASTAGRREISLKWSAAAGSSVFYRYGVEGGPEYETSETSGRLVLPADGPQDVFVRSFAKDRWSAQTPGTATISPSIGRAPLTAERLEGANRYSTSAAVSQRSHPGGASTVVLTSGANWPDALSASVLAKAAAGPLLLTRSNVLPIETRDELVRLDPSLVIVIGGSGAVSGDVASDVRGVLPGASVTRIGGADRYETAALVAQEVERRQGAIPNSRAVIASGQNYPDALSGAPMAAAAGWPILLTRTGSVPAATLNVIDDLGVNNVLVLGGDGAVSPAARSQLPPLAAPPLAGSDRYSTSRIIAAYARDRGLLAGSSIGVATGKAYPDALSAGPLLAEDGAPAILANTSDWLIEGWLSDLGDEVDHFVTLGGEGAVSRDLEFDLRNALRAP